MNAFIPAVSPTKLQMLAPSRGLSAEEDGVIEIPDSAGLSDETREAIYNVWAQEDQLDDGLMDGMHCLSVPFFVK